MYVSAAFLKGQSCREARVSELPEARAPIQ